MNLIFSADRAWGIGKSGALLFRVPGDMKYFRRMTTGRVVVMGRKTLETLPGGAPLPERDNVILTRDHAFTCKGAAVCRSLEELFAHLARYADDDIMVIGGEQIYRQLMPYAGRAFVTRWQETAEADSFVPDFDAAPGWRLAAQSEPQEEKGVRYRFCTYEQATPSSWRPAQ